MSHSLFLPPYLTQLGYGSIDAFYELGNRAVFEGEDQIIECPTWKPWRGILEYLSCVEFARSELHQLPHGKEIGSIDVVPARYNSASLVFFAQATLDNIALWLSNHLSLNVKGSDCAFHKTKFRENLVQYDSRFSGFIDNNSEYIEKLEKFRQEWIHRLSGGASVFSNAAPSDPDAKVEICVPIEPSINLNGTDGKHYLKKVENCRKRNGGRWLYTIDEFADYMADGCKSLVSELVALLLVLSDDSVTKA